jgi:D-sedoheptulose 7-phosphate isomerase
MTTSSASLALDAAHLHCRSLEQALVRLRRDGLHRIAEWGRRLAIVLPAGGRLLVVGNSGSAAVAQHLTAELVGRSQGRPAYSAISLHAETPGVTATGDDYGFDQDYARQVTAHGRPGDVVVLLSTSGRSADLISAAVTGRAAGLRVWAMTGPGPNPLAEAADEALCIDADTTATVLEAHLVAVHLLCEGFDAAFGAPTRRTDAPRAIAAHGSIVTGPNGRRDDSSRTPFVS